MTRHPIRVLGRALLITAALRCGAAPDDLSDRFAAACAGLADAAERRDAMTVVGHDGWLFFAPELRHVGAGRFWGPQAAQVSRARQADQADPLPAILDFKQQLDQIGVELLVVPVPPKSVVYPERLPVELIPQANGAPPRLDPVHQEFYELLRSQGVDVLDLTPLFLSNREHPEGPAYCLQDTHWSGVGCVLAAGRIADEVRRRPWYTDVQRQVYRDEWQTITITGDLWSDLGEPAPPKEQIRVRRVGGAGTDGLTPIALDLNSRIILLGDSHNLVFHAGGDMHGNGTGLADQLALELGLAVDVVAVRGSGATPARLNLLRRAQRTPGYWTRKRLVIWCFAAREFTESDGWQLVPIGS